MIWIFINSLSILLTIYHLHRLYKDYTRAPNLTTSSPRHSVRVNKLYNPSNDIDTQVRSLLWDLFPEKKTLEENIGDDYHLYFTTSIIHIYIVIATSRNY